MPTDEVFPNGSGRFSSPLVPTIAVSRLLKSPIERKIVDCDTHSRLYICALLGYLTNAPVSTRCKGEVEEDKEGKKAEYQITDEPQQTRTHCLLCGRSCCSRSTLTKHCKAKHTEATTFSQPFPLIQFLYYMPHYTINIILIKLPRCRRYRCKQQKRLVFRGIVLRMLK